MHKGIDESIKATGGLRTTTELLAFLDKINIKLINTTGQAISFVNATGNIIRTYEPATATPYKMDGCCYLVTEETVQSLQLILPSIEIVGPVPFMKVAVPTEPYYEKSDHPFTPNKLIGYRWIESHRIEFKK